MTDDQVETPPIASLIDASEGWSVANLGTSATMEGP